MVGRYLTGFLFRCNNKCYPGDDLLIAQGVEERFGTVFELSVLFFPGGFKDPTLQDGDICLL